MLTAKQNFLETIKKDGKPDRLVNDYEALKPIMVDPLMRFTRGNRKKGFTTKETPQKKRSVNLRAGQ